MRKHFWGFLILLTLFTTQVFAADQVFFYYTDPAGTPLSMTDSSGAVVWKADYKPFGEENATAGAAANDRRFVGKEKDEETGLSYFGARYEDAKTGRFIAPDPVRAVDPKTSKTNEKLLLNPQQSNSYAYALNNPYRYVDLDGREPYLANTSEPNYALLCHVNPHFDRKENFIGGLVIGGTLASVTALPEALGLINRQTIQEMSAEIPSAVERNFARFVKKIPANSKSSAVMEPLKDGGYRFSATSSGEVPGSKAIYEKIVDTAGKTVKYLKTTIDPKGQIVHIKDKMVP